MIEGGDVNGVGDTVLPNDQPCRDGGAATEGENLAGEAVLEDCGDRGRVDAGQALKISRSGPPSRLVRASVIGIGQCSPSWQPVRGTKMMMVSSHLVRPSGFVRSARFALGYPFIEVHVDNADERH